MTYNAELDKDGFRVRRLDATMLPGVAVLEKMCFAEPWSESSLEMLCRDGGVGFAVLAGDGKSVIAYGGMITVLDEGQITNIAVHADFRRQGYGGKILGALLDFAFGNGLESVSLEVRESNVAAINLYSSYGFAAVGRRRGFYRNPHEDALVMVRRNIH